MQMDARFGLLFARVVKFVRLLEHPRAFAGRLIRLLLGRFGRRGALRFMQLGSRALLLFFPTAITSTITKNAATSRYRSISPMFRAPPFAVYFLRGAFAPSPMEAMESRMAVSAMVFFIS